jgi:uncharacterized protein
MNIQSFSMIQAAYLNPTAYGNLTGINLLVWLLSHIFADQKFLSLFSILFGAGIVLFCEKAEEKGRKPFALHLRRNFWLLIIGMIHAYVFWYGDILVPYAVSAFIAYPFRRKSPKTLLIAGSIIFLVPVFLYLLFGFSLSFWSEQDINNTMQGWAPSPETIETEINALQSGLLTQIRYRIPAAIAMQTFIYFIWYGWRIIALMFFGMAFYKLRIITGDRTPAFYLRMTLAGFLIGFPLILWGVFNNFANGWSLQYSMFIGSQFNYVGSLFVALGYLALVVSWSRTSRNLLTDRLTSTGRLAFSNYLGQTLICTFIFYGHGLALFGRLERWQQFLLVPVILGFQLFLFSPLWLKYFRFGPVEWLWRSLTYLKFQPLRRS